MKSSRRAPGASPRIWIATTAAITLLTLGAAPPAQAATQVVDNPSDHVATCIIGGGGSLGQTFTFSPPTPRAGELTEVGFTIANTDAYEGATLTVSPGVGNQSPPATTQAVTFPATAQAEEEAVVFTLDEPVQVIPGDTYSVQVQIPDECPFTLFTGEAYSGGSMLRNGNAVSGDLAFHLSFEVPDGTPPSLNGQPPAGVVGAAYSYAFEVGGTPPPNVTAGAGLPPGLTLSNTGVLSGTPTTAGTYSFSVSASNPSGLVARVIEMQVSPATKPKADVALTLSAPASAAKGSTFVSTATVTNKGPSSASSVTTDLVLPPGVKFVSASAPVSRVGSIVSWSVQNLANGQSQQLKVTVTATKTGPQVIAGGSLRLGTPDPKLLNNVAAAVTKVK